MSTLLLATGNPHKLEELRRLLDGSGVSVVGLSTVDDWVEPVEDGATFEDNALIKARAAASASGLPALADDSGFSVDALNGMPGVLSARWSGRGRDDRSNLELVLWQVSDVPDDRLGAQFDCAAALVLPNGTERVARVSWRGRVSREPRGTNGFGYDPIFVPHGETRTSAELDDAEKDAISHRGQALRAILPHLLALR
ncbi:MAG TPA: RdgB/HAM1 family non-canonical purine NTP pyrophosphatase [Pseudonocardiaceae bacterium]